MRRRTRVPCASRRSRPVSRRSTPTVSDSATSALTKANIAPDFYEGFAHFAQYGPTYQRIAAINKGTDAEGRDEVLVEVRGYGDDLEK